MSYIRPRGFGAALSTTIESSVGTSLLQAAPFTGPAAPFVALGGAIADMLASFGVGAGCGQTCVLTSQFANEASAKLDQNLSMYFGVTPPRPQSVQTAALANFDSIWSWLQQQCSNPQLGSAGQKCISDRQAGACTWKAKAPAYPGEPAAGDCWNWFSGYRDPISNDPNVLPDSQLSSTENEVSNVLSSSSGGSVVEASPNWLLLAAVVGVGIWALS